MIDLKGRFHGTDWLKLETAIEIIGDMIAYYSSLEENPTLSEEQAQEIERRINELGIERQRCYDITQNEQVIIKAYTEYGPFLKSLINEPIHS